MKTLMWMVVVWSGWAMGAMADVSRTGPSSALVSDPVASLLPVSNPARVITTFHDVYVKHGRPRVLVYINRSLVTERGEMLPWAQVERDTKIKGDEIPLMGSNVQIGSGNEGARSVSSDGQGGERLETTRAAVRTSMARPLGVDPLSEAEVRELEEHFQRPFLQARTRLVDQRVAELARRTFATPGARFLTAIPGSSEQREIESLKQSVDVVVEVLARRRSLLLPEPSGEDRTLRPITLTATATNLQDGIRFAQVGSDSLFGLNDLHGERMARQLTRLTDKQIIEQTALALMEQMAAVE